MQFDRNVPRRTCQPRMTSLEGELPELVELGRQRGYRRRRRRRVSGTSVARRIPHRVRWNGVWGAICGRSHGARPGCIGVRLNDVATAAHPGEHGRSEQENGDGGDHQSAARTSRRFGGCGCDRGRRRERSRLTRRRFRLRSRRGDRLALWFGLGERTLILIEHLLHRGRDRKQLVPGGFSNSERRRRQKVVNLRWVLRRAVGH